MVARSSIARGAGASPLLLKRAAAVAIACAALGAPVGAASDPKPLRVCADPDNLPFTSNDASKPGLYLEVAQHVAQALGREMQPVWASTYSPQRMMRTTLFAGQCDMFGGVPSKDAGGRPLLLTRPIVDVGYAIVIPNNRQATKIDDLKGMRVAVQFGSPVQAMLADRTDLQPVTVVSPEEGMQAIRSGRVDAGLLWGPSAGYVNLNAPDRPYKVVAMNGEGLDWSASIGFAPSEKELRDKVDAILTRDADFVKKTAARYGFPGADSAEPAAPAMRTAESKTTPGFGEDLVIPNVTTGSPLPEGSHAAPQAPAGEGKGSSTAPPAAGGNVGFGEDLKIPPVTKGSPLPQGSHAATEAPAGEGKGSSGASAAAAAPDPAKVREGQEDFNGMCVHCHGPDAVTTERKINLRLLHHKYGDRMDEVFFYTVTHGRPDKGMPNWTGAYTDEQFEAMLTFLHTVQEEQ
jgi:polar amino acid transport system substrate-binding protein